jgi:hypothetical protein
VSERTRTDKYIILFVAAKLVVISSSTAHAKETTPRRSILSAVCRPCFPRLPVTSYFLVPLLSRKIGNELQPPRIGRPLWLSRLLEGIKVFLVNFKGYPHLTLVDTYLKRIVGRNNLHCGKIPPSYFHSVAPQATVFHQT